MVKLTFDDGPIPEAKPVVKQLNFPRNIEGRIIMLLLDQREKKIKGEVANPLVGVIWPPSI